MITCERCLYWDRSKSAGRCRINPPTEAEDETRWPWTNPDDWCGQAMPRDTGRTSAVHEAAQRALEAYNGSDTDRWQEELEDAMDGLQAALERMRPSVIG